ncbi:MAG: rhomboid family intramembrane serine protease [Cyanobacteria bacterium J083]|nr:MAG: rhomboid family intramembrane serine protease [Cyanobacteria bacterium J083]
MIPLSDENPVRITPVITYLLIVINVVIFVHEISLTEFELNNFFHLYAVIPRELSASLSGIPINQPVPEILTLFTSQFLHGGFMHIGGNMLFLWIFGNNIEESLGRLKYLIFYLTCGALAGLAHWFFSMNSAVPTVGASGAIAGVMGAYILKYPKARILTLIPIGFFLTTVRIPAFFFLGFWFIQQAFNGIVSLDAAANMAGVAYWAHAGGFVFGAILAPLLGLFDNKNRQR